MPATLSATSAWEQHLSFSHGCPICKSSPHAGRDWQLTNVPSIPQDPEARSLIVGVSVAGYYAISAWSQVLVWPASQAPLYKYGWQSSIAIWIIVLVMTCTLRFIDVRYLHPKREAFDALAYNDVDPAVIEGLARTKSVGQESVEDGCKGPVPVVRKVGDTA